MSLVVDASSFAQVLAKFGGKDKVIRFLQYGCRFNKGIMTETSLVAAPADVVKKNWSLFVTLMNARRCYRMFNGLPTLLKLRDLGDKTPWGPTMHPLFLFTQFLNMVWPTVDHYRFLILAGLVKGNQGHVRVFAYRLFALAQICSFVASVKLYVDARDDEKAKAAHRWNAIKAGLNTLTIGHVSQFPGLVTNELVCGSTGMASSAMDIYTMWPKTDKETADKRAANSSKLLAYLAALMGAYSISVKIIQGWGVAT